jgi:DNA-binding cell septation regulator SpoVG
MRLPTISDVRIRFAPPNGDGLIGWASCVIGGVHRLNDILLVTEHGDLALRFPKHKSRDGRNHPVHQPINSEFAILLRTVLRAEVVKHNPSIFQGE